jgi:hypothetical protein
MYGKKKICKEFQNEINNTDYFSHDNIISNDIKVDEFTNSENIHSDKLKYNEEKTNNIKIDESSNIKLIRTDEMTYRIEGDTYNNENEMLTDINTELNTSNSDEVSNKKNFSDIYTDELTNIKEEQIDVITSKISNENIMINDSVNSLSYNIYTDEIINESNTTSLSNKIYSDEISYEYNNDELLENKKISDMNSFETSTDISIEPISNAIENSIISDMNESVIPSEYDSTSSKSIIITEKLSYINNISSDNFLTNKYNLLITDILTNNNGISIEELLNDKFKDVKLSNEQLKSLYEIIKEYIIKEYNGDNIIIKTNNVKIQISNIDVQKYSE